MKTVSLRLPDRMKAQVFAPDYSPRWSTLRLRCAL
jgi:hypothetical protein